MNIKEEEQVLKITKEEKKMDPNSGYRSGGPREVFLRLVAAVTTLCAAIVMGLDKQTIDLYGVYAQAKYYYSPAFTYFMVANATAAAYALLSVAIFYKSNIKGSFLSVRKWLFFSDFVMTLLMTSSGSAATAIGYVGLKGNNHIGWMKVCDQFDKFCYRIGGAVFASSLGLFIFIGLTVNSARSLHNMPKV